MKFIEFGKLYRHRTQPTRLVKVLGLFTGSKGLQVKRMESGCTWVLSIHEFQRDFELHVQNSQQDTPR